MLSVSPGLTLQYNEVQYSLRPDSGNPGAFGELVIRYPDGAENVVQLQTETNNRVTLRIVQPEDLWALRALVFLGMEQVYPPNP